MIAHSLSADSDWPDAAAQTQQSLTVLNAKNIIRGIQNPGNFIKKRCQDSVKIVSAEIAGIFEIFRKCLTSGSRKGESLG